MSLHLTCRHHLLWNGWDRRSAERPSQLSWRSNVFGYRQYKLARNLIHSNHGIAQHRSRTHLYKAHEYLSANIKSADYWSARVALPPVAFLISFALSEISTLAKVLP